MKLLLTSGGITNKSIVKALFDLVGKKPEDISLVFIPTASNVEMGDKWWLIEDLVDLKNLKLKSVDIADISAVPENIWKPKFNEADILFFEGGSAFHLMEWVNKSGLTKLLPEYLKTKVFVGISAGSMIASKNLALEISKILYEEDLDKTEDMKALNLVDFYILPHLNSQYFTKLTEENIRKATKNSKDKFYALDDNSALKVVDGKVEAVSEGKWFVVNE